MTGIKTLLLFTVCGFTSVAGPELLSAVEPPADSGVGIESIAERVFTKAITALGPLAILGWYLYHNSTKALPAKDAQLTAEREAYQQETAKERAEHRTELDTIVAELRKQNETTIAVIRACESRRGG